MSVYNGGPVNSRPVVSIIIPFQELGPYLRETLDHVHCLSYKNIEVVLLPDKAIRTKDEDTARYINSAILPTTVIPTGPVSPAVKRDRGAEKAKGEILAFIDDDAYPQQNWLEEALGFFKDPSVCGVGGPQVTPDTDSFWQRVSGAMFLSFLNGSTLWRYYPCLRKNGGSIDDWPSVNLLVRRRDFLTVGGFDSAYWPGEDTKLCRDLILTLEKKIVYASRAVVFHHRRASFRYHLKQVGNYGLHRGYFARIYPETSLRITYMLPSIFVLGTISGGVLANVGIIPLGVYIGGLALYALALTLSSIDIYFKIRSIPIALFTIPYLVATHFWYGTRFLWGILFIRRLRSKLGR